MIFICKTSEMFFLFVQVVRKNIARILTVYNTKQKAEARKQYSGLAYAMVLFAVEWCFGMDQGCHKSQTSLGHFW